MNPFRYPRSLRCAAGLLMAMFLLSAACPALAIHPKRWVHTTEADLSKGEPMDVVVTNLGDLKLATSTELIASMPEQASIIYDLATQPDGSVYIAAGAEARLLHCADGKVTEVLKLANEQVFALDEYDGKLLLAISGKPSRLAVLDGDKLVDLATLEDARYIWDVIVDGRTVYLATGTQGVVLRVVLPGPDEPDGKPVVTTLLDAKQANVLCLGRDAQGRLYAGTDTDGLVYRLTLKPDGTADSFVLYDASEPEIGAMVVTPDGTVYAGTADANQARPGRLTGASSGQTGRPDPGDKAAPAAGDGDKPPVKPPHVPDKPSPVEEGQPADQPEQPAAAAEPGGDQPAGTGAAGEEAAEAAAATDPSASPTAEQRDALREEIRRRLMAARTSGEIRVANGDTNEAATSPQARMRSSRSRTATGGTASKQGNAVYRIAPDGFVREVFRESVMILRMVANDGQLYVATGNEGHIFRVNEAADETTVLVELEENQVPAMVMGPDHRILLGTANKASLIRLGTGPATSGTYTSEPLDAGQVSRWGLLYVTAHVPSDAVVDVQTRSGNVDDPEKAPWSAWSEATTLPADDAVPSATPRPVQVASPSARFIQYRLTLKSSEGLSPVVDSIVLAYVVPNLRPVVEAIAVGYEPAKGNPKEAGPTPPALTKLTVKWKAADPNGDQLRFTLDYRPVDGKRWLTLVESEQKPQFEWDSQRVPDGRYVVRLTASDHLDNTPDTALTASRTSDPIVIDNTAPVFADVRQTVVSEGQTVTVTITGRAVDETATIMAVHYAVDQIDDWQQANSDDLIYDSTAETFTIKITGLSPSEHVITLRAADGLGNAVHQAVMVDTGK